MIELFKIQQALKVGKNQKNTFGNYNYRSCEDIMEAVKPILESLECILMLSDSVEMIGDRVYVKATATLLNKEDKSVESTAFAREPLQKKGMDDSQITGATSSYARKYALNGLLCIDDAKDADTQDNSNYQHTNESIEWLSSENFEKTLNCGDAFKIENVIKKYSNGSKNMKTEYRTKLEEKIKELKK